MSNDMKHDMVAEMVDNVHIEDSGNPYSTAESLTSAATERKLVRKIDLYVLPWLCVTYALSLIDRSNIAAAKLVGMEIDLRLTGNRYNVALLVFFVTYILTEIPSNAIIKRIGSQVYLTVLITCWGAIALCFGFVNTYGQLLGLRVLLGFFEGGFNPACIFIISSWYKRYEVQQRLSIWFVFGSVVSGFTGIISYGLSRMDGLGNLNAWRWVFIIPGIVTVALAVPIFLFVAEFPEQAKWLSAEELSIVRQRLSADRGEVLDEPATMKSFLEAALDWKVYVISLMLMIPTATTYALSFFSPSILAGFGFNIAMSQILTTPPYVFGAIVSIFTGIIADKVHLRSPFIIGYSILHIIGLAMIGWGNNQACQYSGMFLAIAGSNCAIPSALAFLANNVVGVSKRQFAVPIQTVFGGVGGIIGSVMFRKEDYPTYRPGLYAAFGCTALNMVLAGGLALFFWLQNRKADRTGKVLEGLPGFRYTI
ncbi:major facilitator superfamily domain-containing protein [Aspergillus pseudodeflectus]|uniref:Major facilitator superfamily domain-containing protein n=1 Tax=Aspergillus pseudodeflectus TaxID=176178 RepID=A0ABR4JBZ8_9EURO